MSQAAQSYAVQSDDARLRARRETVLAFGAAWDGGDVETLLRLMSDSPVYKGSTGPGPGTHFSGRDDVRAAFTRMVGGNKPSAEPKPAPVMHLFDEHALVYWTLNFTDKDGKVQAVPGVDVLHFAPDGRITMKDAYRKAFG